MDNPAASSDPRKLFRAISGTEQLRETLYNTMLDISRKKYLPQGKGNAFGALEEYLHSTKPDEKTAPWQQTIIYQMAILVNAELQLEIERRHGIVINPDLNNNG